MRWILVSAALCLLLTSAAWGVNNQSRTADGISISGVHAQLPCAACHQAQGHELKQPSSAMNRAAGCVGCHQGYAAIFDQSMATRTNEKQFVAQSFNKVDPHFFEKNCQSCHVSDCLDCHGGDGHQIERARQEDCLSCHRDYFVGREYLGMAPREDANRYQRGALYQGEPYLKMRPDLHAELQMECRDCHTMQSLIAGRKAAKDCTDCHQAGTRPVEHRIEAHMNKLECYACHSAWAPQEYGTFFLRLGESEKRTYFRLKGDADDEYLKSSYLKRQDAPPLGINSKGKVSPIRPQFIVFYSDLREEGDGTENQLTAARWQAFFPHTVRSGSGMCDSCHGNARRFLLENEQDRIYFLERDGLPLASFWSQEGQVVGNGAFFSRERYAAINEKSPEFIRTYVEKWKKLVESVEGSLKD